jgi:class 3 adenylate cyclase/tetratricopeptide (TPR) repeat protein
MHCSGCDLENPSGSKFCMGCGLPFARGCSRCAYKNPAGAKFCQECGTPLVAPERNAGARRDTRLGENNGAEKVSTSVTDAPADGERKTVTALFADIKGSMELIEDLDPEEARAIVDPALKLMIDAVNRYEGYVAQSTGDGIFALFGAPVAHEDHPQRALYAALRMQEELRCYAAELRQSGQAPIESRIGVNTGEVVVRSLRTADAHTEYVPVGHSTGLAARMQVLAPTGSIAVTENTEKLCEGYFTFKALGPTRVKGISGPVNIFEVVGLGPLRTRLQLSARRGLTRFVGREPEIQAIARAAEQAKAGRGQIAGVVAEPGVGKSRLFYEFKLRYRSGWMVLEAYSVSHGKASAYLPLIDLLHSYFRIVPEDDIRTRREKVNGKIVTLDRALEDALPYLFGLLALVEGADPLAQMDAQIRRRRTLDAIKRIILRESANQPLMLIFEDLHWIDEETQALLDLLTDSIASARVLLLVNYRPEYSHDFGNRTSYTRLRLEPLGKEGANEMLTALLGESVEIAPLKHLIIDKSGGTPLFMEETIQALYEDGTLVRNGYTKITRSLNKLRIPATVQAILASRIDRLSAAEKELLQTLAVIGNEFSLTLATHVVGTPEAKLVPMLSSLQEREFIFEQLAGGDIEYTFKHALTHDVAYNSILTERRKILHERTAAAIDALWHDHLDDHVAELAHHYGSSGNAERAVEYLTLAAKQAAKRAAYGEALGLTRGALERLSELPRGERRDRSDLRLQASLCNCIQLTKDYAAGELAAPLERWRELAAKLNDDRELFGATAVARAFHCNRRELVRSRELTLELMRMAEGARDSSPADLRLALTFASEAAGHQAVVGGDFIAARGHYERALELFDPELRKDMNFSSTYWWNRYWWSRYWLCALLFNLGYPEQALRESAEAVREAKSLDQPLWIAVTSMGDGALHLESGDSRRALDLAELSIQVATHHGLTHVVRVSSLLRADALCRLGQVEEGTDEMRRILTEVEAEGFPAPSEFSPQYRLAMLYGAGDDVEASLTRVTAALETLRRIDDQVDEAQLHRVKGELLSKLGADFEAEQCFRTAMEIARRQSAKTYELRATTSLARLLAKQGRRDKARATLAEIYNWFTEGFNTADLKDARMLLEELTA